MRTRFPMLLWTLLALVLARDGRAQGDLDLLTTSVPPNVMILFDNSGSMNHHLWDDDFDPNILYSSCLTPSATGTRTYFFSPSNGSSFQASCKGQVRTIYTDTTTSSWTRYDYNYLNWLFQASTTSAMLADEPQQTRLQAAKQTINAVIDTVNPDDPGEPFGYHEKVRFGLAQFMSGSKPKGGFVKVPITDGNKTTVMSAISNMVGNTWTPLSETLVDIGRYFAGANGLGSFSTYNKNTKNGGSGGTVPGSPLDVSCRNNFVIIVTDGEPTKDDQSHHSGDFNATIGNADGDCNECTVVGASCSCVDAPETGRDDGLTYPWDGTDWLDDVAYYLNSVDLDPILDGTQNLITYTIGFTIDHPLLSETAANGSGTYFTTSDTSVLVAQLSAALQDIIARSTAFAAATVPTSRSAFGDGFYNAYFVPDSSDAFWPGHLEAYRLSSDLQILDRFGNPAIDSASGQFIEPRNPYWDAQTALSGGTHPPRMLYTTRAGQQVSFDKPTITASDLAVTSSDLSLYPGYPAVSFASPEELADGLVDYLDGQDRFDQDSDGNTSELRANRLGDIFHSSPIAIGPPSAFLAQEQGFGPPHDASSFLGQYATRDRVLYVGANDGMLHGFDAGSFQTGDDPSTSEVENGYYDQGDGQERFGYVPGLLLDQLKYIPINLPRNHYYVDGSPEAADVWLPSNSNDTSKDTSEWATVLVTGMREGGSGYLALDVTDPGANSGPHGPYPKLLWEFDETQAPVGETWSEPVITRVKVRHGSANGTDYCGTDTTDDGGCREQWVAIFAGGYRPDGNPNDVAYVSDPNSAAWTDLSKGIFMVKMDTGELLAEARFDPTPGSIRNAMRYSMPATPAVLDLDFDGFADVIYAVDLGGQVWRWDLSQVGEDQSTPSDGRVDNWPVGLLFQSAPATLASGGQHYHSIFNAPAATYLNGELVLAFASGERTDLEYRGVAVSDPLYGDDDDNNRLWVVWDRTALGTDPNDPNWTVIGEGHSVVNGVTRGLNDVTGLTTDPDPSDDGYYLRATVGEKFITDHVIFAGVLITLTYVPDDGSGDVCNAVGTTNIWLLNLEDAGGLLDASAGADLNNRRLTLGPGAPTNPRITVALNKVVIVGQTSLGNIFEFEVPATPPPPIDLVYWRQLF
ncbi:MAG: pilus assembly protein [Myxococcota bacterium]